MSSILKFDVSEIRSMKGKVEETAKDLDELKEKIVQSIEQLRGAWNTPAGKQFLDTVDIDWSQQVDKYIKILETVEELLETAATEYETVEAEAKKINF